MRRVGPMGPIQIQYILYAYISISMILGSTLVQVDNTSSFFGCPFLRRSTIAESSLAGHLISVSTYIRQKEGASVRPFLKPSIRPSVSKTRTLITRRDPGLESRQFTLDINFRNIVYRSSCPIVLYQSSSALKTSSLSCL